MLDVTQLSRKYGDFTAVDNVSFTIGKGEIVGLLGHNGAGKTTIMKMLSGYLEPDSGSVVVDDLALHQSPEAVQKQLGYLPESPPLYPEMTVADYMDYAAELKGLRGDTKFEDIKHALRATDLLEKILEPIATLSRGFKQRVGVAQALLGRPRLLILDEPTNGLDPEQTRLMRQLIRDIAKEATVILSTHIMQEVSAVCSRVLILRSGKLVVDSHLDDLQSSVGILVDTSLSATELQNIMAGKIGATVTQVGGESNGIRSLRVILEDVTNVTETRSRLAQLIVAAGGQLYGLRSEQKDLEALFREVTEVGGQEVSHHAA